MGHRRVQSWRALSLAAGVTFFAAASAARAQFRMGLRAGVSLSAPSEDEARFSFRARDYRLSVDDVAAGFHLGVFAQVSLGEELALQPEVLLHATRTDYLLEELLSAGAVATVRTERYSTVEFPLLLAYRWGALRLQAGPVGRARLAQSSELEGVAGYADDLGADDFRVGYQAGVGLDAWRFVLDVKYDGSFGATDADLDIGGQRLALSQRASRTYLTLGYALIRRK